MTTAELRNLIAEAHSETKLFHFDRAEILLQQVVSEFQFLEQSPLEVEMLRAEALLGSAFTKLGRNDYESAIHLSRQGLEIAELHVFTDLMPKAWNILGAAHQAQCTYDLALDNFAKAQKAFEEQGDQSGVARITGNLGNVQFSLGRYDLALAHFTAALACYEKLHDNAQIGIVFGYLGGVYQKLEMYELSLEYYQNALNIFEEIGDYSGIARITGNIGNTYLAYEEYDKTFEYYQKAAELHERLGEKSGVARLKGNIGIVYFSCGDYYSALENFLAALALHEEIGEKSEVARVLGNIGVLYSTVEFEGYNTHTAEYYLLKALDINQEFGFKYQLYSAHKYLSDIYKVEKRWEEFALHFEKFYEIEKEVNSEKAKKSADQLNREREEAEREKSLAIARAQHEATEQLLHNVLPPLIANKMMGGTKLIAEKLSNVSVLFADIVNFTKLSQRITPEELVDGLDKIFSQFDTLAEQYGLEKIKTIGDAYMVASGAPLPRPDHAEAIVLMALAMLKEVQLFTALAGGIPIDIRIGIHTGDVVAGVIGKKKFAYDLWGDAVNTASRMESHGEPGKIHVTEEFMRAMIGIGRDLSLLSENGQKIQFVNRGKMEIKGKGMMNTYFLERVNA